MPFEIKYTIDMNELGWAWLVITSGVARVDSNVSYLHDSLGDLARVALEYVHGFCVCEIPFIGEPGAIICKFFRDGDSVRLVVHRDPDALESGARSPQARLVLEASEHHLTFARNVCAILHDVWTTTGLATYRAVWHSNDFPLATYLRLRILLDRSPLAAQIRERAEKRECTRDLELALLNCELAL
ncbi:MAG: hypothetical protein KF902_03555 [Phycisphaeraceae bacterium]|nr:hypothetical protein [Phycisphaeraceae bacterium]